MSESLPARAPICTQSSHTKRASHPSQGESDDPQRGGTTGWGLVRARMSRVRPSIDRQHALGPGEGGSTHQLHRFTVPAWAVHCIAESMSVRHKSPWAPRSAAFLLLSVRWSARHHSGPHTVSGRVGRIRGSAPRCSQGVAAQPTTILEAYLARLQVQAYTLPASPPPQSPQSPPTRSLPETGPPSPPWFFYRLRRSIWLRGILWIVALAGAHPWAYQLTSTGAIDRSVAGTDRK